MFILNKILTKPAKKAFSKQKLDFDLQYTLFSLTLSQYIWDEQGIKYTIP